MASGSYSLIQSGILVYIANKKAKAFLITSIAPFSSFYFSPNRSGGVKYLHIQSASFPPSDKEEAVFNIDVIQLDPVEGKFSPVLNTKSIPMRAKISTPDIYTDSTFKLIEKNW